MRRGRLRASAAVVALSIPTARFELAEATFAQLQAAMEKGHLTMLLLVKDNIAPAAMAGYPSLTVPMGALFGLPVGPLFFGPAWSEARLLAYGHAYERATRLRTAPKLAPVQPLLL